MNQIRAFGIEQGITFGKSVAALLTSLDAGLGKCRDVVYLPLRQLIRGLQQDWNRRDTRIEITTSKIEAVSKSKASHPRLMTIGWPLSLPQLV